MFYKTAYIPKIFEDGFAVFTTDDDKDVWSIKENVKQLKDVYILTSEQLKELWSASHSRGFDLGIKGFSSQPSLEDYLKSKK